MVEQLTEPERRRLEARFLAQLQSDCRKMRSLGYRPRDFLAMIGGSGAVAACIQVIISQKIPNGFLRLLELDHLDLTAAATALKEPWRRLFND
jgi:hypothetical protein